MSYPGIKRFEVVGSALMLETSLGRMVIKKWRIYEREITQMIVVYRV